MLLLLLLVSTVASAASQQTACGLGSDLPPICRCTVDNGVRTVDCSSLDLLAVPRGIPNDTVILKLSDNSIEQISSNSFANLVDLRELYIANNVIRSDLLDDNAFQSLRKLEQLDLHDNRIILLQGYETPFLPLVKLSHLDLGGNNIATIDPVFLTIFDRLDTLFMISNQIVCDCSLLWFKNWLLNKGTRAFSVSGVVCFTPASVFREAVETANFCIPVQRCYDCEQASTNAACNFNEQQCSGTNPACQNEVRINNGRYRISKQCQTLDACLNNARQNENDCNSGTDNSVCRYCCQGDRCNAPESAIYNGYQFPFPDTILAPPVSTAGTDTTTPVRTTITPSTSSRQPTTPARPTALTYCPAEVTPGVTGRFLWPKTIAGDVAILPCAYGMTAGHGTRTCLNGETHWDVPTTSECPTVFSILKDLSNTTIRRENALNVSETLTDVTSLPDILKPNDVTNVVDTFENLANALYVYGEDSPDVLRNVLGAVNHLTDVPEEQLVTSQLNDDSSSRLLRSIDNFNLGVQFQSNILEEDTPSVDVVLIDITDPMDSGLLFFGSGRPTGNSHPRVVYNTSSNADEVAASNKSAEPDTIVKGSMYMPNSLLKSVGSQLSRCQFVMYEETTFFDIIQAANKNRTISNKQEDEGETVPTTESQGSEVTDGADSTTTSAPSPDCISTSCRPGYQTIINSVAISGAVGDLTIDNLDEPVTITFRKMRLDADNPRCVFWDEAENDGWGGWSNEGCSLDISNKQEDNIVCKCNHLTNFAMLMDVYDTDTVIPEGHQIALSAISYVGCCLSLIGLVLTLITHTCCGPRSRAKMDDKKFSFDKRSKVLVNFVVSLILVNVFFIAGSLTAEFQDSLVGELCTAMAVCLHYSLLVAMAWMAIQAFNMYMALVKVFATYYSHFLLKMMLGGWGIPLVIVGITLGVDLKNYGSNKDICWLSGISFYVAFLLPVCLVLTFNAVIFVAVTWKLCKLRKSKISSSDRFDLASQMRASVSITFLLGLTWILGIFAIGEASLTFNYLFATFNSLQGFAVFVFQCLLQPEMRQRWIAACCPYCAPETADSKSGVYSTSRSQTNLVNQPNNNWRKDTKSTTVSTSYVESPVYDLSEG